MRMVFTYKTYVQLIPKRYTFQLHCTSELRRRGGGGGMGGGGREGWSKNFVVLKLQPVNLKRFLAVTNRYQHGQGYLTTKEQFDSWE